MKGAYGQAEVNRRSYRKLKESVLQAYGGKCCRCGFDDRRALQVDHVHGGGNRQIRKLGGGAEVLRLIRKLNYPMDYQLLCANCNWIKRYEAQEVAVCPPRPRIVTGKVVCPGGLYV